MVTHRLATTAVADRVVDLSDMTDAADATNATDVLDLLDLTGRAQR
jgi:hypothetical protein